MFNYGLLNLGSLIFGLAAWILPFTVLIRRNTYSKGGMLLSWISVSACAISLYMQIVYTNYLVKIEDWSALMDTNNAVRLVSTVLIAGMFIVNGVLLIGRAMKKTEQVL